LSPYKCCGPLDSSAGKPTINKFLWVYDSLLLSQSQFDRLEEYGLKLSDALEEKKAHASSRKGQY